MDSSTRIAIVAAGALFIVIFGGMTLAALETAQLNFASLLAFGFSFLIIVIALIGVIGAIRTPPGDD
jgi:hypothetical protein